MKVFILSIGYDMWYVGFCGSSDDFIMCVWWSVGGKGDDEDLLVVEGGDEVGFVVIVDWDGFDIGREVVGVVSEGCYGVFVCL